LVKKHALIRQKDELTKCSVGIACRWREEIVRWSMREIELEIAVQRVN
jgi:hypothetical protein